MKIEPGFLCGLEFDSLSAEQSFFQRHGLRIEKVEVSVDLQPGELLVFDNLAVAQADTAPANPERCTNECSDAVFNQRPSGTCATSS